MGNKQYPDEVTTAMELAEAAGWKVSNRNKKIVITTADGVNITIGHTPNEESLKVFRSNVRRYNLFGQGPARTPGEADRLHREAEKRSDAEAERMNKKRKAFEEEQRVKQRQIEAAREKAQAATEQGMKPPEENITMPKTPAPAIFPYSFPTFDASLLGTKDYPKFRLPDGQYYCVECLKEGKTETFRGAQGLAAHRGVRHQLYLGGTPPIQETSRVQLPVDVNVAMDMLRVSVAEALGGGDPGALADKDAELEAMRAKLIQAEALVKSVVKQADTDRADFDKRFLEAQASADKQAQDLRAETAAMRQAEINTLTQQFMELLKEIQKTVESYSPAQAVGKVDEIIRDYLI